jgi:signal transduction histidine kinase
MILFGKKPHIKSISKQISLSLFIITFLIFLATEQLILERSYNALLNAHDLNLRTRAETLASLTDLEDKGILHFDFDSQITLEYSRSDPKAYFLILDFDQNKEVSRSESLGLDVIKIPPAIKNHEFKKVYFWTDYLKDTKVRFIAYREIITTDPEYAEKNHTQIKNHEYIFIVGRDFKNLNIQFIDILKLTSASLAVGLIILLVLEQFILRKNLKALNDFRDEVKKISSTNLAPVSIPAVAEVAVVAETLNNAILQLNESFSRERRFTADVAHELRTPISEIRTLMEVTLGFPNGRNIEDLQNYADILAAIKQMENIVKNLLMLTRLDSNIVSPEKSPMDLNKSITTVWDRYKDKAALKNISLKKNIDDQLKVFTDHEMFLKIVENLVANAIEYSSNGSVVEITAESDLDYFNLSVTNSVMNLTNEDIPMIFDRFWRKDKVRTPDGGHCGLGLSIVKSLVEFLGLNIHARLNNENRLIMIISGLQKPK